MKIRKIEPWIANLIKENTFLVLRDKERHTALGVAYGMDGIEWITDAYGRLLYFKRAFLSGDWNSDGVYIPKVVGDTRKSDKVYVEKFVPRDHKYKGSQDKEIQCTDKSLRMLYTPSQPR